MGGSPGPSGQRGTHVGTAPVALMGSSGFCSWLWTAGRPGAGRRILPSLRETGAPRFETPDGVPGGAGD